MRTRQAHTFAAYSSGSVHFADQNLSAALAALAGKIPKGGVEAFTVLLFKPIVKAVIEKLKADPSDATVVGVDSPFSALTSHEFIAYWLFEFCRFSEDAVVKVLELDPQDFRIFMASIYRKMRVISVRPAAEALKPHVLH